MTRVTEGEEYQRKTLAEPMGVEYRIFKSPSTEAWYKT